MVPCVSLIRHEQGTTHVEASNGSVLDGEFNPPPSPPCVGQCYRVRHLMQQMSWLEFPPTHKKKPRKRRKKKRCVRPKKIWSPRVFRPAVNPRLTAPVSPAPWVTEHVCSACGQGYDQFNAGITWSHGKELTYSYPFGDSRGPVLWAMRVSKLYRWFAQHEFCGHRGQYDLFWWAEGVYGKREPEEEIPF